MSTIGDVLMIVGGFLAFVAFIFLAKCGVRIEEQDGYMDMGTFRLFGIMKNVGIIGLLLLVVGYIVTKL